MNDRARRVLEFDKVLAMLTEHATSKPGKAHCMALRPVAEVEAVRLALLETSEAAAMLLHEGNAPFGPIYEIGDAVKLSQIGGCLTPKQLIEIGDGLRTARMMKRYLLQQPETEKRYPKLFGLANQLISAQSLEKAIGDCIINENEISDHASPELHKIRRQIEQKNAAIRQKLESLITSQQNQKYLQEALITIRQDRFVIPVKSEYKQQIKGIVHDQSAKGSTFYIEPLAVVELNNQLRTLKIDEQKEIERILRILTGMVAENGVSIVQNVEILVQLDFIFAKAKLAERLHAVAPEIADDGIFKLKRARHPLIASDTVVANTIWLGEHFTTLLITGPNTGGKTVTLKTVGLLTLMAQAGLHIPVDYGSKVAVFDQVFADIGDEQSIEQSLSTFSSHMTNIVSILADVSPKSLVLFDELGAGTDPTEGAALAMAILDQLKKWQVRTMATTHYAELKAYAINTPGIENASVEFDVASLSPTYRLLIGIPGKSNAFEISKKLGLSQMLIDNARTYVHQDNIEFEDIIAKIEESRKIAETEQDEAIRLRLDVEKIKKHLEDKETKMIAQRDKLLSSAKDEARQLLKNAKEEVDKTMRMLREAERAVDKRGLEAARKQLNERLDDMVEQTIDPDIETDMAPTTVQIGDSVRVLSINQDGTVLTLPNEKGELSVQVGLMKMNVNLKGLLSLSKKRQDQKVYQNVRKAAAASATIKTEIDVRGENIEDAIVLIDQYIDQAVLANLHQVRIIHGKGTGALRKGLHDHFKRHRQIKHFEYAAYNEGGNGATVLEFR
ncbi:endonuclease MutS2 [Fusibacter paucivorans]|uniref:Endonuclease MutS2 n=1 Tax=Fusibacter paucivorans TaxID=76009 RepID=A0ABS5PKE6_9FIRM|nr:endonuclease MutS2 [Fusibacter paucivorans]MBS7525645.1 endonuclease MutS2 [Fusibacter paucivorans]